MDFLALVQKFHEKGVSNTEVLSTLGFQPREAVAAIDALKAEDIAESISTLGQHIHPVKMLRALQSLGLDKFGMLKLVAKNPLITLPMNMGSFLLQDDKAALVNSLPDQLVVVVLHSLLRPRRERIASLQNFAAGNVAEAINNAKKILVLTGAGISTSCGSLCGHLWHVKWPW